MTTWNLGGRSDEPVTCVRCLESRDPGEVDRLRWCSTCKELARSRARKRGWQVGVAVALVLALWIWIVVRPTTLIWGGWLATIVACLYLVARLVRELHFGLARIRNVRAAEARPPGGRQPGATRPGATQPETRQPETPSPEESAWEEDR